MIQEINVEGLKCVCVPRAGATRVVYMIYPAIVPFRHEWIVETSEKFNIPIVVVYIPADGWNNMLTPWPEPGETRDAEPFGGDGSTTLEILQKKVIPEAEKMLGVSGNVERNLIGVSLSGLFTFWQWMQCETFTSIASLSGSFWYPGFMEWFEKQSVPQKKGKAYFLLGDKEPKAWIREYRSVGVNTEAIVARLKSSGVSVEFEWVPGDHFADPAGRALKALNALL